jgi:Zn-dependent alcohol dehydrogenase
MLSNAGRYLEIGNISPGKMATIDPSSLVMGSKTIYGVVFYGRDTLKKSIDFMSRAKNKYPFDKLLGKTYKLEDINKAFEEQDKGLVSRSAIVP